MTVNELLGLSAEANQTQILDRVMGLVQNERDLLELTGAKDVGAAMGTFIAQKEAATELAKAREEIAKFEAAARADEATALKTKIDSIVQGAVLDGRISAKDEERKKQLVRHGEKFGVESLTETVAMLSPRPVRQFQAPVAVGDPEVQRLNAYNALKAANPGIDPGLAFETVSKGAR